MKSTLLPFVMIMTLLFLLPTGCRKEDSVSQLEQADAQLMRDFLSDDYFATASEYYNPPPADPSAQTTTESCTKESMTTALKDYFAKNPDQVKKINQKYGYPVWAHVENFNDGNDFILVPFARTNKSKIDAFLINYFDDTSKKHKFMTVDRSKIDKYFKKNQIKKVGDRYTAMSYELAAVNTIHFENEIFSTVDCSLLSSFNLRNEKELENRSCSVSSQTFSGSTLICVGSNENPCAYSYVEYWSVTIITNNCSYDLDAEAPYGDGGGGSVGTGSASSSVEYETEGDDILRYYISDIAPEGICKNSIKFVNTCYGRTACVEDRFRMVTTNTGVVYWVNLSYCITIPGWMDVNTAQQIVASNLEAAKDNTHDLYRLGVQTSSGTVKGTIDAWFKEYSLADLPFSSVSSGRCQNVSCNKVTYEDFWGNCN